MASTTSTSAFPYCYQFVWSINLH